MTENRQYTQQALATSDFLSQDTGRDKVGTQRGCQINQVTLDSKAHSGTAHDRLLHSLCFL